jgi:ATP-dependent exoDNAse (exonuclease V) alpha subunit
MSAAPAAPWAYITPSFIDTEFVTGSAGTGKTYEIQRRSAADPEGVILAATTGIAAVNLGPEVTTVHSLLKFFDYNSLVDAYDSRRLHRYIRKLVDGGMRELVIDEISMLSAPALDLLYNAFNEVARDGDYSTIKLTLVGDFCQLPPIADRDAPGTGTDQYAFDANCWRPNFSEYTTRLTKIWRQDHEHFVHALQAARRGAGDEALAHLQRAGVRFEPRLIGDFDGTTLCAINHTADCYNFQRLCQLAGDNTRVRGGTSTRWSLDREPSEWRWIPDQFGFTPGAYVMILSNNRPSFTWVNGDCGTVVGTQGNQIVVRLKRNGSEVLIGKIIRTRTTRRRPGVRDADVIVVRNKAEYDEMVGAGEPPRQVVMLREPHPTWITGWVRYFPLRLAYATTVHKSQGLSLDALQLDLSSDFLASPAMMYVALSRCRTPEGLVLVGNPEQVVAKTNIDPRVQEWL